MGIENIILDSSVIVSVSIKEQYSTLAKKIIERTGRVHTLDLAYYEATNALNMYRRSGKISDKIYLELVKNSLAFLEKCTTHQYSEVLEAASRLAVYTGVAIYDSVYVALASKLRYKLLTVDLALYNKLSEFPELKELLVTYLNN